MRLKLAIAALTLLTLFGCEREVFSEPLVLGGETVSAETLNLGHRVYQRNCASCHAADGSAELPANGALRPPPRDLRLGHYKFKSTPDEALPTDEDLARVIRRGLPGTYMNPFPGLEPDEVEAVVDYIKTFSPRWSEELAGTPVPVDPDPWTRGEQAAAIARGEAVYHGVVRCWTCHPAYLSEREILDVVRREPPLDGDEAAVETLPFRGDMRRSDTVPTENGRGLPPDFLSDICRAGASPDALYRTIAAGVGGTSMNGWYGRLEARDLWALAHYVRDLTRARGTERAEAIREQAE